jgi:hypothetical protein
MKNKFQILTSHFPRVSYQVVATSGNLQAQRPLGSLAVQSTLQPQLRLYTRRGLLLLVSILILISGFLPFMTQQLNKQRYDLSTAAAKVVGPSVKDLLPQLKLDGQGIYNFNADYKPDPMRKSVSAGQYRSTLATTGDHAVTVDDPVSNITLKFIPKFDVMDGKKVNDHILFPASNSSAQLVYSLKANGLKEDIVLPHYQGNQALDYDLVLPAGVEARVLSDGSIGIYSADPTLFGNISYGSDKDKQKVEQARQKSAKTNLVFTIPAPIIKDKDGKIYDNKARFSLSKPETKQDKDTKTTNQNLPAPVQAAVQSSTNNHYTLTVNTKQLNNLPYPISIDPSVRVSSASDFGVGNFEDNVDLDSTNNAIVRGALTGGTLENGGSGWITDSTSFSTARDSHATVAYNGVIYVLGGSTQTPTFLNDVQYAKVASNGSIIANSGCGSSWCATTSFATARANLAAVAYNGYLYVIGGCSNPGTCSDLADVQYAKIDTVSGSTSGGLLANSGCGSTWCTATSMPAARNQHWAVANNGYIYVTGGYDTGGSETATTWGVPIRGDGSLGTWVTTLNTFTTARVAHGMTVFNGYLYILGGCNASCTGFLSDVQYAPIKSDGTLGTWSTTTSFSNAREDAVAYAYKGFIYIGGGFSATANYWQDVSTAPINPDGTLGNWVTTSQFNVKLSGAVMTEWNNVLYVTGGFNKTINNDVANIERVPVDPAGSVGSWTDNTPTTSYTVRKFHASVAYNGYIYVIGGCGNTNCGTTRSDIYYATINADGTVGNYATTTALTATGGPSTDMWMTAHAYNGYLYLVSGCTSEGTGNCSGTVLNTVYYTTIANNGTLGASWSSVTTLGARYAHASALNNGYLYIMGGCSASSGGSCTSYQNDLEYTQLSASTGVPTNPGCGTTFCTITITGTNPFTRMNFGASIYNNYLYVYGGCNAGNPGPFCTSLLSDTKYAKLTAAGTLSGNTCGTSASFCSTSSLPVTDEAFGYTQFKGSLYVFSGCVTATSCGTISSTTYWANINSDGTIGSWQTGIASCYVTCNSGLYGLVTVPYGGGLYTTGGFGAANEQKETLYGLVNNGGTGQTKTWGSTNSFTTAREGHATVVYNGYLYVIGGCSSTASGASCSTMQSDVQYAPINADGTVGTWNSTSSFTTARFDLAAVATNGFLYVIGGCSATTAGNATHCQTYQSDVQKATINANGTLGSFSSTSSFTTARYGLGASAYNGYLYVLGGCSGTANSATYCNAFQSDVQYASINTSTGALGSFSSTSSFTTARYGLASIAYNGYIYLTGGCSAANANCTTFQDDTQYAPLNSNGTVGTWAYANSFGASRFDHSMAVYNGNIYLVGGCTAVSISSYCTTLQSDTQAAPILNDGSLGNWQVTSSISTARSGQKSAAYNGHIFITGGCSGGGSGEAVPHCATFQADVQSAGIQSLPRKGTYSYYFDMDTDVRPTKVILGGSQLTDANLTINFSDATSSGLTFNNNTNSLSDISFSTPYTLSSSSPASVARYYLLSFNLDDSAEATFPDATSNALTINDFDLYFNPNPGRRLRGGKTFINQNLTNLDAQP